jgi:serine phosphatase RsbU (regulator of sigma subunit)
MPGVSPAARQYINAFVSGHGVPAALIASMVKVACAAQAEHAHDPALVLARMNRALCARRATASCTSSTTCSCR